ncbi:MAG: DUF4338 domain-containing protein, partial [Gammaproteobacteria bacterium]|nr:DUF4338 domain-containing protein [Gammaproteobacteria bacterium]
MGEVEVRPVRADERRRWDELMRAHHYLGFKQFAGRGLRHVATWRGHWLALLGWQSEAFKCAPRDRWLGWHRSGAVPALAPEQPPPPRRQQGEDAARFRAGHAPANHAALNNIVLAVVFHNGFRHLPEANRHYMMRRGDALHAIVSAPHRPRCRQASPKTDRRQHDQP